MESFNKLVKEKAQEFKQLLGKEEFFRIYSHLDADGISSATIMIRLLKSQGKAFQLTIIEQLTDETIKEINEKGPPLILLDFGSGQLTNLKKIIKNRQTLILDHHQPQGDLKSKNLMHINPCLTGIDGGTNVSASGVTYLFSREFIKDGFNASLGAIGAQGDLQNMNSEINSLIITESTLTERQDLDIYGLNTRPIHKALEYSEIIPDLNDETSIVNFLIEINIPLKEGSDWRTINDLTSEEKQRLISNIIVKRGSEDIFTNVHELKIGKKRSLSEWSAVLNACGRMNMPSMGISALLNPSYEKKIDVVLKEYKNTIAEGLRWFDENKEKHLETNKALFFIGKEMLNYKIVGTICSIKSMNTDKEFIVGFADNADNTKVSIRRSTEKGLMASELASKASQGLGEGGGHAQAAGATIKKGSEEEFIKRFNELLK